MIRPGRLAAPLVLALAVAALTACVQNDVSPVRDWLAGRAGVSSAEIVVDRTDLFGSSGVVRGELDRDLDAAGLDRLIAEVAAYAADHDATELRLGRRLVDFTVDPRVELTSQWRETWEGIADVGGLVAANVDETGVLAHVLRPDLAPAWSALEGVETSLELEAFRTAEDEEIDRGDDDYGGGQTHAEALRLVREASCDPSADAAARVDVVIADDAIRGGVVDLCGDVSLRYTDETDLVAAARYWAERQASDPDPARSLLVSEGANDGHVIDVTPGRPDLFAVAQPFEVPGGPDVFYTLPSDGTFTVHGFGEDALGLLEALQRVPESALLTSVAIEGDAPARAGSADGGSVSASGSLADLGPLLTDAVALLMLDPQLYSAELVAGQVTVSLYSPPGSDPDMEHVAASLRSSPLWQSNVVVVEYLNGYVAITDGIAEIGADYTDREPYDAFIAAWNAGSTG